MIWNHPSIHVIYLAIYLYLSFSMFVCPYIRQSLSNGTKLFSQEEDESKMHDTNLDVDCFTCGSFDFSIVDGIQQMERLVLKACFISGTCICKQLYEKKTFHVKRVPYWWNWILIWILFNYQIKRAVLESIRASHCKTQNTVNT